MNAIYTQDYKNPRVAEILKQYCEKKYGRKKEFVDAEIAARIGILTEEQMQETEDLLDESMPVASGDQNEQETPPDSPPVPPPPPEKPADRSPPLQTDGREDASNDTGSSPPEHTE